MFNHICLKVFELETETAAGLSHTPQLTYICTSEKPPFKASPLEMCLFIAQLWDRSGTGKFIRTCVFGAFELRTPRTWNPQYNFIHFLNGAIARYA